MRCEFNYGGDSSNIRLFAENAAEEQIIERWRKQLEGKDPTHCVITGFGQSDQKTTNISFRIQPKPCPKCAHRTFMQELGAVICILPRGHEGIHSNGTISWAADTPDLSGKE